MDLKGKDSFRGISLSYGWLANQIGHMALGYFTCLFFLWVIGLFGGWRTSWMNACQLAFVLTLIGWFLFEAWNVYFPLRNINNPFGLKWANLINDVFVDLLFFYVGAALFGIVRDFRQAYVVFLFIVVLLIARIGIRWFHNKIDIQVPGFPLQFRLGQWYQTHANTNVSVVKRYMADPNMGYPAETFRGAVAALYREVLIAILYGRTYGAFSNTINQRSFDNRSAFVGGDKHLLIFGDPMSGKSKLAISIATEYAFVGVKTAYFASDDFEYHLIRDADQVKSRWTNYNIYWTRADARVLVVDNISGGIFRTISGGYRTTDRLMNRINYDSRLRDRIFSKDKVIWVIHDSNPWSIALWVNYINMLENQAAGNLALTNAPPSGVTSVRNTFVPV